MTLWVITEPVSKRFFDLSITGRFWKAWEYRRWVEVGD
jgi:hypothetical protein